MFFGVEAGNFYCWWFRNPGSTHQLRLVVYPIIYRVLCIPSGCLGFLPSTVPLRIQPGFLVRVILHVYTKWFRNFQSGRAFWGKCHQNFTCFVGGFASFTSQFLSTKTGKVIYKGWFILKYPFFQCLKCTHIYIYICMYIHTKRYIYIYIPGTLRPTIYKWMDGNGDFQPISI